MEAAPTRFTIRPDDYHIPYAGTAVRDGRRFFLSEGLFHGSTSWVGLFLWHADGRFDEMRVRPVGRAPGRPPGQAAPVDDAADLTRALLAGLGDYVLEPFTVEPFTQTVDGVDFGWKVGHYDDGACFLSIEPGDFICYYAPWDGHDYDT